jgi:hypothetical protein
MKPIEKMNHQAVELGMKKYDELMEQANKKYEEALDVYNQVKLVKEALPKALEEYDNLSQLEQMLLDSMLTDLIMEVEKEIGGAK